MSFINILQLEVTKHFSLGIMAVSECWVSVSRLQQFLESPELLPPKSLPLSSSLTSSPSSSSSSFPSTATTTTAATDPVTGLLPPNTEQTNRPVLSLTNVTCNWYETTPLTINTATTGTTNNPPPTTLSPLLPPPSTCHIALSDINLTLHRGSLTCIVGPVGSGKSALLLALAGELTPSTGRLRFDGGATLPTLSYAAQDPWIMNGSVRENILMAP